MIKNQIQCNPDMSRIILNGQLYNCIDGDSEGLFRNSITAESVLVERYVVKNEDFFHECRVKFDNALIKEIDFNNKSEEDLSEVESIIFAQSANDERLNSVIFPYTYAIQDEHYSDAVDLYIISDIPAGFREKYKNIKNIVFDSRLAINLRINIITNLIEITIALNEKFNDAFHSLDLDAIFINIENGDVKVLFDKLVVSQFRDEYVQLNESLAFIVFELLCLANPYDGKKTLVDNPLITKKTERNIRERRDFIFSGKGNGVSDLIGKEALTRWNSLPEIIRSALEDNLDSNKNTLPYDLNDWLYTIRKTRDLLVFENGRFKFCILEENEKYIFFKVNGYLIPIWARKAVYGYHIGESNYKFSRKVILGVDQTGKVKNLSGKPIMVWINDKTLEVGIDSSFIPKVGMAINVDDTVITIGTI